jgi:hypothetical protein
MLVGPFELLRRFGARLGPYVLLELLLPGGTMFALLLFLYRRRKPGAGSPPALIRLASPPAVVSTLGRDVLPRQPDGKGEERPWNAAPGMVRCDRGRVWSPPGTKSATARVAQFVDSVVSPTRTRTRDLRIPRRIPAEVLLPARPVSKRSSERPPVGSVSG